MKEIINIHIPTFVWVIVNLLVLYAILKRVLFKPVTEHMEKRANSIREAIDNADKSRAEAAEMKNKYDEQLKSAKVEADRIINEARNRGTREYEAIVGNARQDAETILTRSREEIERERAQMIKDIKNQVATLALAAASKVLEANMDTESNRKLVDRFVEEEGAA